MNTIKQLRIFVFICAAFSLVIPFRGLAITQTRVSQINQFIAELGRGKFTDADSIKKRATELKKGLNTRDLNSVQIEKMNGAIEKALGNLPKQQVQEQEVQEEEDQTQQIEQQIKYLKQGIMSLNLTLDKIDKNEYAPTPYDLTDLNRRLSILYEDLKALRSSDQYNDLQAQLDATSNRINELTKRIQERERQKQEELKAVEFRQKLITLSKKVNTLSKTNNFTLQDVNKLSGEFDELVPTLETFKSTPFHQDLQNHFERIEENLQNLKERAQAQAAKGKELVVQSAFVLDNNKVIQILAAKDGSNPNIINANAEVIINPTNKELTFEGPVSQAILDAAGPQLSKWALDQHKPVTVGTVLNSPAYNLDSKGIKQIFHAVGPKVSSPNVLASIKQRIQLETTWQHALQQANNSNIVTIAFPSISTGISNFDIESAAYVAAKALIEGLKKDTPIKTVKLVLWNDTRRAYIDAIEAELKKQKSKSETQSMSEPEPTGATSGASKPSGESRIQYPPFNFATFKKDLDMLTGFYKQQFNSPIASFDKEAKSKTLDELLNEYKEKQSTIPNDQKQLLIMNLINASKYRAYIQQEMYTQETKNDFPAFNTIMIRDDFDKFANNTIDLDQYKANILAKVQPKIHYPDEEPPKPIGATSAATGSLGKLTLEIKSLEEIVNNIAKQKPTERTYTLDDLERYSAALQLYNTQLDKFSQDSTYRELKHSISNIGSILEDSINELEEEEEK